jgi:anti-sigma-K factor RskA
MTEPNDPDLLALATPYALHAMSESEVADVDRRLAAAPAEVAQEFTDEVRAIRETMAVVSAATAVEPPQQLRDRVLAGVSAGPVRQLHPRLRRKGQTGGTSRLRGTVLAAAAALVIGLGALGVGLALRPAATPSTAEQVFAAPDVRAVTSDVATGGTATVVFSREKNAAVLVMNNVPPPAPDTVYQMWLLRDGGPESAGIMEANAVAPSTTRVLPDIGNSSAVAFTVEPPGGSPQPTGQIFAELPLV